jgi:L-asparaginase
VKAKQYRIRVSARTGCEHNKEIFCALENYSHTLSKIAYDNSGEIIGISECMPAHNHQGVFILYTGGTIGSVPKDRDDPLSPLVPADLPRILDHLPNYSARDGRILLDGRWIHIGTHSWPDPVDSSNIKFSDWIQMARVIKDHYDEYDGFVIIHGTDTLAYTASALAFMLDNLNKPVVITGSQLPIGVARSDAIQNLMTSIEIAAAHCLGAPVVPEVTVFFRDELYRGCRTTKISANNFNAFCSPNYPPLARADERIVYNSNMIRAGTRIPLHVVDTLDVNVASIAIFPGMSTQLLRGLLATEGLRGVALQSFGAGNAPASPEFLDVIAGAVDRGITVVDVTQCRAGEVELGLYDVSAGLLACGVVSGVDMTIEAALTKLSVVLGSENDPERVSDRMQLNLRGEQRQSIYNLHFSAGQIGEYEKAVNIRQRRPMLDGLTRYSHNALDRALFRIMGVETADGREGEIEFKAYMDLPDASEGTPEEGHPYFLGKVLKRYRGEEESVFLTVTDQARLLVDNRHSNVITIVSTGAPFRWKKLNIAFYCNDAP